MTDNLTDGRALQIPLWKKILNGLGIYIVILVLIPICLCFDSSFLSAGNLGTMLVGMQHLLIVVLGASFITYSGKMADLSIPSTMMASGFISLSMLPYGFTVALLSGLATGAVIGLINGAAIGFLKLNPIIWTLAMNFILQGVFQWAYAGEQVYPEGEAGELYLQIASTRLFGSIPLMIVLAVVIGLVLHYLMKHSKFGDNTRLTGSSECVAEASGVNVASLILKVFVISSVCTALGGMSYTASSTTADYVTGVGYDFNAVTAIVLGGISLQGGKGFLSGALGGLILISMLENILSGFPGVNSQWQELLKASIFIAVVALSGAMERKAGKA